MRTLRTSVLVVLGLIWLVPVYLLLVNAVKAPAAYRTDQSWIPTDFSLWQNITEALALSGLGDSVVSTAIYAVVSAALAVIVRAAAGFPIVPLRPQHGFPWFLAAFRGSIFPPTTFLS